MSRSGGSAAAGNGPRHPLGVRFVAPLALGAILNPINSTMIATALAPIADSLRVSAADAVWLIAVLYAASAIAQPAMGRLADLFGPRRTFLMSLILVGMAGVLGLRAASLGDLVVARVVLGVGASGAYPCAMRIFRVQAERLRMPPPRLAMGVLAFSSQSVAALGPLLGGLLTAAFGWRAIFSINLPLAALTAILLLAWSPQDAPPEARGRQLLRRLDLPGMVLFSVALISLMGFLMELSHPNWTGLGLSCLFGAAFSLHAARTARPFIDVRMLVANLPLSMTYLRAALLALIIYGTTYALALWMQGAAGFSGAQAGLVLLPASCVGMISALSAARSKGLLWPFAISLASALLGALCLLALDTGASPWAIAGAAMLFGIIQGTASTATQAAIYVQAPHEHIGAAAGLQRTAQYLGAISAAGLLALVYGHRASDATFHQVAAIMAGLSALLLLLTLADRTIRADGL